MPTRKRNRRTPNQIVADLQTEIERVRTRTATNKTKSSPEGRALHAAIRAIDRALDIAREAGNKVLIKALDAGRAPLSEQLVRMGLKQPATTETRRRRGKAETAR